MPNTTSPINDTEYVCGKFLGRIESAEMTLDSLSFSNKRDDRLLKRIRADLKKLALHVLAKIECEARARDRKSST